jgi:predicted nucleotidyltransferase
MLIESNTQKFLSTIFKFPTKGLTIREIARLIKVSPPTASSIAKTLEKKNLIRIEKERVQYKVFGNLENEGFRRLKRIYNIFSLLNLVDLLIKEFKPNAIVVFGSYSKGEDVEDSDVDIFIDTVLKKEIDLRKFEERLSRTIHLHVRDIRKIPDELRKNIINGVILYGFLEC